MPRSSPPIPTPLFVRAMGLAGAVAWALLLGVWGVVTLKGKAWWGRWWRGPATTKRD